MMTEFIGFLIIIGALITVLIRRQTHSKRSEEDVFDGYDDRQRPDDKRQNAEHIVTRGHFIAGGRP